MPPRLEICLFSSRDVSDLCAIANRRSLMEYTEYIVCPYYEGISGVHSSHVAAAHDRRT